MNGGRGEEGLFSTVRQGTFTKTSLRLLLLLQVPASQVLIRSMSKHDVDGSENVI